MTDLKAVTGGSEPLTSVNAADEAVEPVTMVAAVTEAVTGMTWLTVSDRAMTALALEYARQMDDGGLDPKAFGYLGQNLTVVLRALGGAPGDRKALGIADVPRGKLQALRAAR